MTAVTKTTRKHEAAPRKRAVSKKNALRLPKSATFTKSGGQEFLLVPVADFEAWLEDQLDAAEARASLADPAPRISQAEVKRRLGMK